MSKKDEAVLQLRDRINEVSGKYHKKYTNTIRGALYGIKKLGNLDNTDLGVILGVSPETIENMLSFNWDGHVSTKMLMKINLLALGTLKVPGCELDENDKKFIDECYNKTCCPDFEPIEDSNTDVVDSVLGALFSMANKLKDANVSEIDFNSLAEKFGNLKEKAQKTAEQIKERAEEKTTELKEKGENVKERARLAKDLGQTLYKMSQVGKETKKEGDQNDAPKDDNDIKVKVAIKHGNEEPEYREYNLKDTPFKTIYDMFQSLLS